MTTLKSRQSAATKASITDAALRLFAQRGFVSTALDDIAKESGITKGAIYWHFKNKDDLFTEILAHIRTAWHVMVFEPCQARKEPKERIEQLFSAYLRFFTAEPEICLFLQRVQIESDPRFAPQVTKMFEETVRFIGRTLDDGKKAGTFRKQIDSRLTAYMILSALGGANVQCHANKTIRLKDLLETIKQSILDHTLVSKQRR